MEIKGVNGYTPLTPPKSRTSRPPPPRREAAFLGGLDITETNCPASGGVFLCLIWRQRHPWFFGPPELTIINLAGGVGRVD